MKISFPSRALCMALLTMCTGFAPSHANTITSPDGNVVANVTVSGGNLVYSVTFHGTTVVETSPLAIVVNGSNVCNGVTITGSTSGSSNFTFDSRHGVHAIGASINNSQTINVTHATTGRTYVVTFASWNNGVAFRYEFTDAASKAITSDASGFVLPAGSLVYRQTDTSVYEGSYSSTTIDSLPANTAVGPPPTIKLPGSTGYLSLTESGLSNFGLFPNPYLVKSSGGTGRQLQVAYPQNADGTYGASGSGTLKTPWNVVMLATDLNMLLNNDIVESLAFAPSTTLFPGGAATSWCKSGRSVWDYLNPQPGGITAANAITNNTYAGKLGFEYNTIDEGWANWNGGNPWPQVQSVVSSGNSLNVRILLWKRSSELATQAQRTAFFSQLQACGVAGCKIDFFDYSSVSAGAKERVKLQEDILKEAAGYQLVVNFHGSSKPTGWFRTYPNLIQTEAIYGKESIPGTYNMTLEPFTRFLAGPADFTPLALQGTYNASRPASFEIATALTMAGPLITFAERSDNLANSVHKDLIKKIPTLWDETIVLGQSSLGATCAMARRKGQDWWLVVTNSGSSRSWTIPFTFLSPGVTYQMDRIRDASTGIESSTANSTGSEAVSAAAGGGLVIRFYRPPANGTYSVINKNSILGLNPSGGGTANNTPLVQSTYNGGNSMRWTLTDLGSSQYKLVGVASGRALDVYDNSTADNTTVELYSWLNGSNQKFTLTPKGSGYFLPLFVHSGKGMKPTGGSTSVGAGVVQYTNNGSVALQWDFQNP